MFSCLQRAVVYPTRLAPRRGNLRTIGVGAALGRQVRSDLVYDDHADRVAVALVVKRRRADVERAGEGFAGVHYGGVPGWSMTPGPALDRCDGVFVRQGRGREDQGPARRGE